MKVVTLLDYLHCEPVVYALDLVLAQWAHAPTRLAIRRTSRVLMP